MSTISQFIKAGKLLKNFSFLIFMPVTCSLLLVPSDTFAQSNDQYNIEISINREEITDFHSDIVLYEDSSIEITETITVNALGNRIKRGIYRDYPTIYTIGPGFRSKTGFEIIFVTKDGLSEPYHTEALSNGVRVYFGEETVYLEPGTYTYQFKYRTDRQINYEEKLDILSYNVTGDDWAFPILRSSATLILPGSFPSSDINSVGYAGVKGSDDQSGIDINISQQEASTRIDFVNSNRLDPGSGFTIRSEFPKGIVQQPTQLDEVDYFIRDNFPEISYFISSLVILMLTLLLWYLKGRDPASDVIYPQYNIPEGLTPATARFIDNMAYDTSMISVILISLATKGYVKIEQKKKKFFGEEFIVTKQKDADSDLPSDEALFMNSFFPGSYRSVTFSGSYSSKIFQSAEKVKRYFTNEIKNTYFRSNLGLYALLLLLILIVGGGFMFLTVINGNLENLYPVFMMTFWDIIIGFFLFTFGWVFFRSYRSKHIIELIFSGAGIIFLIQFIIISLRMFITFDSAGILVFPSTIILLLILLISPGALKLRTENGRFLQDQIEGLKMFILATEEEKIRLMHNDLPQNMDTFNKYFPYALALGIEAKWVEQFEGILQASQQQDQFGTYNYGWYTSYSAFSSSNFSHSLGATLTGTVSSSSTPPSSSGGGGGAGGGGGGGGGGGW